MHFLKRGQLVFIICIDYYPEYYFFSFKTGVSLHHFLPLFHDLLFNTLLISVACQKYYNEYFFNHFIKIYFCSFIFYLTLETNEINTRYVSLGIWFLIMQIFLNWINQKTTTLVTYSLECDSIKLSQFVCAHFELRKKNNWSQPLSNCSQIYLLKTANWSNIIFNEGTLWSICHSIISIINFKKTKINS